MISIYDTTLRDGAQTVGISFSLNDKLLITSALDRIKIDYIEGGWPGSNPKDDQFFVDIRRAGLTYSKMVAFGSTKRKGVSCGKDSFLQALINSKAPVITIVSKTWDFHVTHALNITLEQNLTMIRETIAYLKDRKRKVFLDAEHFFDGFKSNEEYSHRVIATAAGAGADMIVLCDTNGGAMPHEILETVDKISRLTSVPIGVHFHNDAGIAVANSMAAVQAGAVAVQGTANGYGERCGNCNLMTLIPNLVLKMGYRCAAGESLPHLTETSRLISELANLAHDERAPYVGDNSFAHKGGIHVSALEKDTRTYEHVNPELVGNRRKVLISELSGKSNILFKARELGIDLKNRVTLPAELLQKIKALEEKGYQFEAAEGSFELLLREATGEYRPFFKLKGFRVISEMDGHKKLLCEATIKVDVEGRIEHTAANGRGPVEALDNALRKALEKFYPEIREIHLSDYKVRVLNEKSGTGASVRVLIDQRRKSERWGTVGVSTDIIEASWQALVDGIEYMLFKKTR
ncbi:MAG: citramalate synthase [Syntrophobacterales bacterium]|nr:MAG: citramalate synthase [Syntrophobacterales bacterium]